MLEAPVAILEAKMREDVVRCGAAAKLKCQKGERCWTMRCQRRMKELGDVKGIPTLCDDQI
jgi:hypothetical protein